jgi:monoamine oxidase
MRVAVVGAGLAAADALAAAGVDVVVLEARDRVGGRVWSRELENGAIVEMGAEFILPGNDTIHAYAERFGLGLWEKGMLYGDREPRGGKGVSAPTLRAALATIDDALPAVAEGVSAAALLELLPLDPPLSREAAPSAVLSVPERYWCSPDGAVLSTWDDDPWARAAYSCAAPERGAWAPAGPFHVCGEHTHDSSRALMEGALASGLRAAHEVVRAV